MTVLKLDSKVGSTAQEALDPYVPKLYGRPGTKLMAVVELARMARTEPDPDSDDKPSVKVKITRLEVAGAEQEEHLREAQRFLYLQRSAHGTFDDDGQMELSERTLELTGRQLAYVETARLRAALQHWALYARKVQHGGELTATEAMHEMQLIAEGLTEALAGARPSDGESG